MWTFRAGDHAISDMRRPRSTSLSRSVACVFHCLTRAFAVFYGPFVASANDEFNAAHRELLPLIRDSRSQDMGTFLAGCISTEADDETLRKITKLMHELTQAFRSGDVD
jgi:hypothetical protein